MKKYKLAVLADLFLPISQTFVYDQLFQLKEYFEIIIICNKIDNTVFKLDDFKLYKLQETNLIDRIYDYFARRRVFIPFRFGRKTQRKILEIIRKERPDICLIHFLENSIRNTILKYLELPKLTIVHGYDGSRLLKNSSSYRRSFNAMLKKQDFHFMFVSEGLKKIAEKHMGKKISSQVQYLGINTTLFEEKTNKDQKEEIRYIQVSRLVPKKGTEYAIRSFKRFLDQDPLIKARFVIIGEGPLREKLEKLIEELSLEHQVMLFGEKNRKEVIREISQSDIFVQHSVTDCKGDAEGLPISIMEAMAMNKPILTTHHSGIPELVKDQIHGLLYQERDVEGFSKGFHKILEVTGDVNRTRIEQKFNVQSNTKRLAEAIKKIINEE